MIYVNNYPLDEVLKETWRLYQGKITRRAFRRWAERFDFTYDTFRISYDFPPEITKHHFYKTTDEHVKRLEAEAEYFAMLAVTTKRSFKNLQLQFDFQMPATDTHAELGRAISTIFDLIKQA